MSSEIAIATELRLVRSPDGVIRTSGPMPYTFWSNYSKVFDQVLVLARVGCTEETGLPPVEGDGVQVVSLPDMRGVRGNLRLVPHAVRCIRALSPETVFLARIPSFTGIWMGAMGRVLGLRTACEVVGDPNAVFSAGVVDHPLRPLLRMALAFLQRQACARSDGVAYVTESYLQQRYPAHEGAIVGSYSSVELPPEAFNSETPDRPDRTLPLIVAAGYMDQHYKRFDLLIELVARLRERGTLLKLRILGDGRLRPELRALAEQLEVLDLVEFAGFIEDKVEFRRQLSEADLFVHASATEGLPRVVLEAMALCIPVIATRAGGTPEILSEEALVAVDDLEALVERVDSSLADRAKLEAQVVVNKRVAQRFSTENNSLRRQEFLLNLKIGR